MASTKVRHGVAAEAEFAPLGGVFTAEALASPSESVLSQMVEDTRAALSATDEAARVGTLKAAYTYRAYWAAGLVGRRAADAERRPEHLTGDDFGMLLGVGKAQVSFYATLAVALFEVGIPETSHLAYLLSAKGAAKKGTVVDAIKGKDGRKVTEAKVRRAVEAIMDSNGAPLDTARSRRASTDTNGEAAAKAAPADVTADEVAAVRAERKRAESETPAQRFGRLVAELRETAKALSEDDWTAAKALVATMVEREDGMRASAAKSAQSA